jgi:hypothetical protein
MNTFTICINQSDGSVERLFTSTNKTESEQYFIRAVGLFSELDVFMSIEPIKS